MENNFKNPIMPGADPFVLLHDGKYYLYCTTENDKKLEESNAFDTAVGDKDGIYVYESEDLVTWEKKGLCLNKEDVMGEKWFWAPEVLFHNGKFYMVYAAEEHMAVAVSDSPLGPFKQEEKKWLYEEEAIDGHMMVDDDGTVYLYYVRLYQGNKIYVAKLSEDLLSIDEMYETCLIEAQDEWETVDCLVTEGPFMLKHKGLYYLTYSANHTRCTEYAVGVAISDNPLGPFKKFEGNPILYRNGNLYGVGHHSFTTSKDGKTLICAYHCHNDNPENFKPRKFCLNTAEFVEGANGVDELVINGPMTKPILYGDGIHDDYPAIQEMINSGVCEVSLPAPKKHYLISKTLVLPSNFKLTLPRFAEIKLADGANCVMVKNQMIREYKKRVPADANGLCQHLWYHVNEYAPEVMSENIELCGGIWNCNNMNQLPNPEQTEGYGPYGYTGDGMLFYGVKNIKLSSMTVKDPVHYGITFDRVSYFTVEDMTFEYNLGNPMAINMDGIHFNGNCHFGKISNLKGACYDDLVALNAHEGSKGPISNIEIDGLFAENCHSAVRLLTVSDDIENIHISNVYGTYYQYCIGFTKYYPGETTGTMREISIDHIYASKASRDGIYPWPNSFVFPLIFMQDDTRAKNVKITDLYRKEYCNPIETLHIGHDVEVDTLILENIYTENHTDKEMPLIVKHGSANRLITKNIYTNGDPELIGDGEIL